MSNKRCGTDNFCALKNYVATRVLTIHYSYHLRRQYFSKLLPLYAYVSLLEVYCTEMSMFDIVTVGVGKRKGEHALDEISRDFIVNSTQNIRQMLDYNMVRLGSK
jgi:hypothetical protein